MELADEIMSLVDNELKDTEIAKRLKKLINDDQLMQKEYLIQKSVKDLLNSRLAMDKLPQCLCDKLRSKLNGAIKKSSNK